MTHRQTYLTRNAIGKLSHEIIGSSIYVHRELGPGLLESVYQKCLAKSLRNKGLSVQEHCLVPLYFEGELLSESLRLDLLVENAIIVELKAVETMQPVFEAQILTYLKLTSKPKGLLINFNCVRIRDDLRSFVTPAFEALP